jgi:protein involved in polysaccharide export with SLBB domain
VQLHRRSIRTAAAAAALVLFGVAEASAQSAPAAGPPNALQPGDAVRVEIWKEPELSGQFTVDATGALVLPKLGSMQATTVSAEDLVARIREGFLGYLNHTSVNVVPLRRIRILGAVRNPGLFPVEPTMTVADALALAGGATEAAQPRKMELVRAGERVTYELTTTTRIADAQLRSGDEIYVPERGWIMRNPGFIAAGIGALTLLITVVR